MRRVFIVAVLFALPLGTVASNAPTSAIFHDPQTGKTCGPNGQPGAADPVENALKNRIAKPATTRPTTVAEFRNLPVHAKTSRANWTPGELAQFKALEDVPVRIVGYLKQEVRPEGKEATNCNVPPTDKTGIDFHMWLVDTIDKDKDRSFSAVVEMAPRWRQANPAWTQAALQALVDQGAQVRISGWRTYDYEHPEQMKANSAGKPPTRSTLWEIHPITMVEVATQAGWIELGANTHAARTGAAKQLLRVHKSTTRSTPAPASVQE
jgi:hypothetical protein